VTTAAARKNFSDVINCAGYGKERVVLTRRNRPLAAVVPIEDIELIEEIEDREDLKEARAARRDIRRHGTVPWTRIKKELGLQSRDR
jgi:prevent-host-death family protein